MQINLRGTFSDLGETNTVLLLYNFVQNYRAAEKFSLKIEIDYFFIGSSYGSYFCRNYSLCVSLLL